MSIQVYSVQNHLFRVVSGLESMVLGETEIVSQVKDAWHLAKEHKTVGTTLSSIFQNGFNGGKRCT